VLGFYHFILFSSVPDYTAFSCSSTSPSKKQTSAVGRSLRAIVDLLARSRF